MARPRPVKPPPSATQPLDERGATLYAGDLLYDGNGALPNERDGHRRGAHAVACDAAGGVGGADQGRRGWLGHAPRRRSLGAAVLLRLEVCQTQPGTIQADHSFLLTARPDTAGGIGGHQISAAPRHGPAG
jgi:hypothetical protein